MNIIAKLEQKNGLYAWYQYMLPNLRGYHWERTNSSLCLMVCTTFSRSHQVMIKIAAIDWFGW